MPEFLTILSITSTALSIATVGIVFLSRTYVTEKIRASSHGAYAERLETLKAQLKAEADAETGKFKSQAAIEIEKLKSQLSSAAAERHVRFSSLHDTRAKVISELYALLKAAQFAVQDYVTPVEEAGMPPRVEREKAAVEAINALLKHAAPTRIFIPEDTALKVDEIFKRYRVLLVKFRWQIDRGFGDPTVRTKQWIEIDDQTIELSKTTLVELEREFRKLLGDEQ